LKFIRNKIHPTGLQCLLSVDVCIYRLQCVSAARFAVLTRTKGKMFDIIFSNL